MKRRNKVEMRIGEMVNDIEASMDAPAKGEGALQSVGVHEDRGMCALDSDRFSPC